MANDAHHATLAALGDPTRCAILARLATGVGELVVPCDMSLPATSKHLTVLERAGLILRGSAGQQMQCALRAVPLKQAVDWLETTVAAGVRRWIDLMRASPCFKVSQYEFRTR